MSYEFLGVIREDGFGEIKLQRPPINALSQAVLKEIHRAVQELESDSAVRAIIIYGEKHFCAGADIKEIRALADEGPDSLSTFSRTGHDAFDAIENCKIPVIAAVEGFCLGGGCELAMAAHFRVASPEAKFGQPEIKLGIIPGFFATWRLPRLVGRAKALELLLTGRQIDAEEACRLGLVQELSQPDESAINFARKQARLIATYSRPIIELMLSTVGGWDADRQEKRALEIKNFGDAANLRDMKEGFSAFIEKRKPEFQHK